MRGDRRRNFMTLCCILFLLSYGYIGHDRVGDIKEKDFSLYAYVDIPGTYKDNFSVYADTQRDIAIQSSDSNDDQREAEVVYQINGGIADKTKSAEGIICKETYVVKGSSLDACKNLYNEEHPGMLDFSHLKIIFIGPNLRKNKALLSRFLLMCEDDPSIAKTVYVWIYEEGDVEFLKEEKEKGGTIGSFYQGIIRKEKHPLTVAEYSKMLSVYKDEK